MPVFGQILALGMTVIFRPWERFFYFPFRSYSSFRKKKLVDPSVFPLPTVGRGHRLPVTALALSAGWIKRTFQTISRLWPQTFCGWSLCTVLSCKHSSSQPTNAKATNIYSQFSNWCHKRVYLGLLFQITSEGRQYKKHRKSNEK